MNVEVLCTVKEGMAACKHADGKNGCKFFPLPVATPLYDMTPSIRTWSCFPTLKLGLAL